jgi:hypothetical protein
MQTRQVRYFFGHMNLVLYGPRADNQADMEMHLTYLNYN